MVSYGCTDVESEDGVIITHVYERESSARFMIMAMFMAQFAVRFGSVHGSVTDLYPCLYLVFLVRFFVSGWKFQT